MIYYSLLCIGDSYTIGENVALHESFPYQLVQMLRTEGTHFSAPEIIAQTGWTTFELKDHLSHTVLNEKYDFVTLLIGVNNQYRNLSAEEYKIDFTFLLKKAISLADNKPERVFILSIPDWGATPFAEGKDRNNIAVEINVFNAVNRLIATTNNVHYIDITESTRKAATDDTLLAPDKLHPSGKEYNKWAKMIGEVIPDTLK